MDGDEGDKERLQPIADIDRTIHAPARLMILAFLSVVEECGFYVLDEPDGVDAG